jgi:hypothetical protein
LLSLFFTKDIKCDRNKGITEKSSRSAQWENKTTHTKKKNHTKQL